MLINILIFIRKVIINKKNNFLNFFILKLINTYFKINLYK